MSTQPLEARLAHLEGAFVQVGERLNSIDRRLDSFEHSVQSRFGQLEQRFGQLERTMDSRFTLIDQRLMWLIGIVVGTWITTNLTMLFHR